MRFAVLDAHGQVILGWDIGTIAERAHPAGLLRERRRKRLAVELLRALEDIKRDLVAL